MSVRRAKKEVGSREFVDWAVYLEQEWNEHSKLDYYLAQIAFWVAQVNSKEELGREKFLLEFQPVEEEEREPEPEELEQIIAAQKASWFAFLGITPTR